MQPRRDSRKKARSVEDRAKSTPKEEGGGDKNPERRKFINALIKRILAEIIVQCKVFCAVHIIFIFIGLVNLI